MQVEASKQSRGLPDHVRDVIRARLMARQVRERQQQELLSKEDTWHATVASKLESLNVPQWRQLLSQADSYGEREVLGWRRMYPWLDNFLACGTQEIHRQCCNCGTRHVFRIQCSQKWCPRCQWKLSKKRVELITAWATRIKHPLHVVLTQRNFAVLTRAKLREHARNLSKLRRTKVFERVEGGAVSIEVTNKGNGWHLHSHWLVDCKWLDAPELSVTWGRLVGQEFGIVKCKPLRSSDYLGEVCKYVAKGNELATWPPETIWEFANAIRGRRFFMTFGELSKCAASVRAELNFLRQEKEACECGSQKFKFKLPSPV